MSTADRDRWNQKYLQRAALESIEPDEWLVQALHRIDESTSSASVPRRALDVASGLGQNAIWLTQHDWQTDAVDISHEGLRLASQTACQHGCEPHWIEADLDQWSPQPQSYELVIVFRFLDRIRLPDLIQDALKTGGWLIYETFSTGQLQRADSHISNPAFTLEDNELSNLYPRLRPISQQTVELPDRIVVRYLGRKLDRKTDELESSA